MFYLRGTKSLYLKIFGKVFSIQNGSALVQHWWDTKKERVKVYLVQFIGQKKKTFEQQKMHSNAHFLINTLQIRF